MDIDSYLRRIGLDSAPSLGVDGLETLQRAHLTAIPFENLDVYARRGVGTGLEWSVPKLIDRGRGGWCFELNGAFGSLLVALGFEVQRRAAVVLFDHATSDPSHLALEVQLERPYLVDVGFGDSFIRPLRLDIEGPQDGGSGVYAVEHQGSSTTLMHLEEDDRMVPQYRLDRSAVHELADFEPYSHRLQTEPGLHWTRSRFATRLLEGGPDRVTLLADRVKFRHNGEWSERRVSQDDWDECLATWFGLTP